MEQQKIVGGKVSAIIAKFNIDASQIYYIKLYVIKKEKEMIFFTADKNIIFDICKMKLAIGDIVDIEYDTKFFSNDIKHIYKY